MSRRRRPTAWLGVLALAALVADCTREPPRASPPPEDAGADGADVAVEADVGRRVPASIAPEGALEGERLVESGAHRLALGEGERWGPPLRVDGDGGEHISFRLEFEPQRAAVEMELLWWGGGEARSLGMTDWAPGFRVLSALDPEVPRTFWVRARGPIAAGQVTIERTPIAAGPRCEDDCDRLLQLPLPLDPALVGYDIAEGSVFAYQYGRRDLLMPLLTAGRRLTAAGHAPFEVKRLSRWDGEQPPSHRSHEGGVDVDLSLYRSNGEAAWYPLCINAGRSCRPGTCRELGAEPLALLIATFFDSDLFERGGAAGVLVDREYHRSLRAAADELYERGEISDQAQQMFRRDQRLLRHVEPHHHHLHIRVGPSPR